MHLPREAAVQNVMMPANTRAQMSCCLSHSSGHLRRPAAQQKLPKTHKKHNSIGADTDYVLQIICHTFS